MRTPKLLQPTELSVRMKEHQIGEKYRSSHNAHKIRQVRMDAISPELNSLNSVYKEWVMEGLL